MKSDKIIKAIQEVHEQFKGGSGSGNFGHSGRPGKIGGSSGGGSGAAGGLVAGLSKFDANGERKSSMKKPNSNENIILSKTSKRVPYKVGDLIEVDTGNYNNRHVIGKVIGFSGYEGGNTHYITADGKEGKSPGGYVMTRKYGDSDVNYIRSQRGTGVNPGNTAYNNQRNAELDALEAMDVE